MKTLTLRVPEELAVKLAAAAERKGENKSALIRLAIESMLSEAEGISPNSCLDLARDLLGSIEGPPDLSHNKEHLEGYGK